MQTDQSFTCPRARCSVAAATLLWTGVVCTLPAWGQPLPSNEQVVGQAQPPDPTPVEAMFLPVPASSILTPFPSAAREPGDRIATAFVPEASMPGAVAYLSQGIVWDEGRSASGLAESEPMRIVFIALSRHRTDRLGWLVRDTTSIAMPEAASAMRFQRN